MESGSDYDMRHSCRWHLMRLSRLKFLEKIAGVATDIYISVGCRCLHLCRGLLLFISQRYQQVIEHGHGD